VTVDPAVRFWLDWAEFRGAACEPGADSSLVLLPDPLAGPLGLPAELSVTADPEVSREDGAVLIAAGHPALDYAAADVLGNGDVGQLALAWPARPPPPPGELLEAAREAFPVDHGRLTLAGEPRRGIFGVLRLGALLTHRVSLHDRFGERGEIWVAVGSGAVLPERIRSRLARAEPAEVPPADLVGGSDGASRAELAAAFAAANRALAERAAARREELASDYRDALATELARTNAYYDGLLEHLARRMASAPVQRQASYATRAEATRAERARRIAEVAEKFRPQTDVTPFRLHVYRVPGLTVPVEVQRGPQHYPLPLTWLLPAAGFLPEVCPGCGSTEVLVASKTRLGCRACLPAAASIGPAAGAGRVPSPTVAPAPAVVPTAPAPAVVSTAPAPAPARAPKPKRPLPATAGPPPEFSAKTAARLAFDFWQAAVDGDRRLRRLVVPESPMGLLRELYGPVAPRLAVGLPPGELLLEVASSVVGHPGRVMVPGHLRTPRGEFPFTLCCGFVDGRLAVAEALPFGWVPGAAIPSLDWLSAEVIGRLKRPPVELRVALDNPSRQLWQSGLAVGGLPLAARRLLCWRQAPAGLPGGLELRLAAVVYEVDRQARPGITYAQTAQRQHVEESALRQAVLALRAALSK
jgi:hypothetical protein